MAFSKYYTQFQPRQRQRSNGEDLLEAMRKMQEQQQAEQQQNSQASMSDWQNAGKLGKSLFGSPTVPTGGGQSWGGGNSVYGGIDIPTSTAQSFDIPSAVSSPSLGGTPTNINMAPPASGGGSWSSGLMSNPWAAGAAAILGSANVMHNKDISPWSDSIKGKSGGNLVDYYQDGDHGLFSKLMDADGATGQGTKGITDFLELDFSNAFGNTKDSLKSLFKGKLF